MGKQTVLVDAEQNLTIWGTSWQSFSIARFIASKEGKDTGKCSIRPQNQFTKFCRKPNEWELVRVVAEQGEKVMAEMQYWLC